MFVLFLNLPTTVKSFVRQNADGSITIVINSRLNREQQIERFRHELSHIGNDDFTKADADGIELEAHKERYDTHGNIHESIF